MWNQIGGDYSRRRLRYSLKLAGNWRLLILYGTNSLPEPADIEKGEKLWQQMLRVCFM